MSHKNKYSYILQMNIFRWRIPCLSTDRHVTDLTKNKKYTHEKR